MKINDHTKKNNVPISVYVLLDRSGSMASRWEEATSSIGEYLNGLENQDSLNVAVFDSTSFDWVFRGKKTTFNKNVFDGFRPRNSTPLYDAAGIIINEMLTDKNERAVLVVMTDGYENCSKEHNQSSVQGLLGKLKARDYQVVFLGADFKDVYASGRGLGIGVNNTVNVSRGHYNDYMTFGLMSQTSAYRASMDSASAAVAFNQSDEDRKMAGENVKKKEKTS